MTWNHRIVSIRLEYLKLYITVCKQMIIIKQEPLLETIELLVLDWNTWNHI